jgi:hypothetical protein
MLSPAEAPKTLEDLARPQFKGKIAMPDPAQHVTTTQWLANLQKVIGQEKADKFIRDLASQKPILVESFIPSAERVTGGEVPLAITYVIYAYVPAKRRAGGLRALGKDDGRRTLCLLGNKSPHPNAARLSSIICSAKTARESPPRWGIVNRKEHLPAACRRRQINSFRWTTSASKSTPKREKSFKSCSHSDAL